LPAVWPISPVAAANLFEPGRLYVRNDTEKIEAAPAGAV